MNDAKAPHHLTSSALELLAGRPVHVRTKRIHGCCGGSASIPVAEPGTPEKPDDAERYTVSGTVVFVDRDVKRTGDAWMIDTDGFARWRRLIVLGLDLAPVTNVLPGSKPGDTPR